MRRRNALVPLSVAAAIVGVAVWVVAAHARLDEPVRGSWFEAAANQ